MRLSTTCTAQNSLATRSSAVRSASALRALPKFKSQEMMMEVLALPLAVVLMTAPPVFSQEVYEGMYYQGSGNKGEIADVGASLAKSAAQADKVISFMTSCAADPSCNGDDLATLRDEMQGAVKQAEIDVRSAGKQEELRSSRTAGDGAVRQAQIAVRSAGKQEEFKPEIEELMAIADNYDCIEIRRDGSTQFMVGKFGAAKVGGAFLDADHVGGAFLGADHVSGSLCTAEADKDFGPKPKTSELSAKGLPAISKAAAIIHEIQSKI
eukprot:gene24116-9691_t